MRTKRFFKIFLSILLIALVAMTTFVVDAKLNVKPDEAGYFDNGGIMNPALNNNDTIEPRNPGFFSSSILRWSPDIDPDAEYSRSTVPLRTGRFYGPQVNPQATPGAKIQTWSNNTLNPAAQGMDTSTDYAFTHWQYVDSIVGWGVGGGLFCIPQAHLIDAAHKNGVPVTALIGFPFGSNPDGIDEFREMVQKRADGTFPVADKMAEVAYYYGFDGYAYNQETFGLSATDAQNLLDFHTYFRKKYPNLIFNWYDSMLTSGGVRYQNQANNYNIGWLKHEEALRQQGVARPYIMDDMFTNYNWGSGHVQTSQSTMLANGRSPYDVYHPFEIQQNGWVKNKSGHSENFANLLDASGKLRTSLGFFCSDSMVNLQNSHANFHENEAKFWGTSTQDPRLEPNTPGLIQGGDKWTGMARYVLDKSVINKLPFTTNFQTGHGEYFFIDGVKEHSRAWTYKSLQDINPTWTWWIDTDNQTGVSMIQANANKRPANLLSAEYDFEDAFFGGNSIKFKGAQVEANNGQQIKLYSTKITQDQNIEVEFFFKEKNNLDATTLYLMVSRGDNYDTWQNVEFIVRDEINGWKRATAVIPMQDGIINGIGVRVLSDQDLTNYELNMGGLNLKDSNINRIGKVKNLLVDDVKMQSAVHANVRLKVKHNPNVMRYEVYKQEKDLSWTFVKTSPNNAIYLDYVGHDIVDGETVTLKVVPVNFNNERLENRSDTVSFPWKKIEQTNKPQEIGKNIAQGSRIWWTNATEEGSERIENIFDGSSEGFRKYTYGKGSGLKFQVLFEPKEVLDVNQIWVCQGGVEGDPNQASEHNIRGFEIWVADEIKEVDYTKQQWSEGRSRMQNEAGEWVYLGNKAYELVNPTLVTNSTADMSEFIVKHLDQPAKGKYWLFKVTEGSSGTWVTRLFELYLYTGTDKLMSPAINMSNATLTRTSGGLANIELKNVPKNSIVSLYSSLDSPHAITTKHTKKSDGSPYTPEEFRTMQDKYQTVLFENVNIGLDEGNIYFGIENVKLGEESNRYGIPFFADGVAKSEAIKQDDLEVSRYRVDYLNDGTNYQFVNVKINNVQAGDTIYIYEGAVDKGYIDDRWNAEYNQLNVDFHTRIREIVVKEGETSVYVTGVCAGVVMKNGTTRDVKFRIIRKDQNTGKLFAPSDDTILDLKYE